VILDKKMFGSFTFLLIFLTLTTSVFSFPFQLAYFVNADTDSNSNDDGNDGDDGSKDGDDDGNDGDDGSKDGDDDGNDGDDGSKDGDDDGNDGDDSSKDGDDDGNDGDDSSKDGDDDGNDGDDIIDNEDSLSSTTENDERESEDDSISQSNPKDSEVGTPTTVLDSESQSAYTETSQTETSQTETSQTETSQTETSQTETSQTETSQTERQSDSQTLEKSVFKPMFAPLQFLLPSTEEVASDKFLELSNFLTQSVNCDPADPACEEPPGCDPEDPFCGELPTDESGRCHDGIDNDDDGLADGLDPDCLGDSGGPVLTPEKGHCEDGIDNDRDGRTDDFDLVDCGGGSGGPGGTTGPGNQLARGANNENGAIARTLNGETGDSFLPEAIAQLVQSAEGQIAGNTYYILIDNLNNETNFVPGKVTLTNGFTVVWINNDNSKDHQLVIATDNGKSLFNSVVHPNNFVKYKFESDGKYFFSDSENPEITGLLTILPNAEPEVKISEPLPQIESIISSIGLK